MTQTSDRDQLRLLITPMQVSETALEPVSNTGTQDTTALGRSAVAATLTTVEGRAVHQLVVYPGEPSELLLQLENRSHRPIYINIQIEKNFPDSWYNFHGEGNLLSPGGKMEAVLYFQIAADFFESHASWQPGQSLKLDYSGRINISYAFQDSQELLTPPVELPYQKYADFNLYVRPRSLYLNFLPELFREVDFIGRFLKIFEQAFEPAVQALDAIHHYLDSRTSPEAILPFLAYWVGWNLSPSISVERQRYLIRQAMEIYRWRGTKKGLRFYLHLYTGLPLDEDLPEEEKHIYIQDVFHRGFMTGETRLGQDSIVGGGKPYHFIVRLRTSNEYEVNEQLVRHVIEQEKPAFCTYELYINP